jgi:hypothetical protein
MHKTRRQVSTPRLAGGHEKTPTTRGAAAGVSIAPGGIAQFAGEPAESSFYIVESSPSWLTACFMPAVGLPFIRHQPARCFALYDGFRRKRRTSVRLECLHIRAMTCMCMPHARSRTIRSRSSISCIAAADTRPQRSTRRCRSAT